MLSHLKVRFFGFQFFLLFAAGLVYNWYLLVNSGYYYLKLSGVAPFGIIGGLLMIVSPEMAGLLIRPISGRRFWSRCW